MISRSVVNRATKHTCGFHQPSTWGLGKLISRPLRVHLSQAFRSVKVGDGGIGRGNIDFALVRLEYGVGLADVRGKLRGLWIAQLLWRVIPCGFPPWFRAFFWRDVHVLRKQILQPWRGGFF